MQLDGAFDYLSDSALDNAYATQFAVLNRTTGRAKIVESQKLADLGVEILHRLTSVTGFVRGAFGGTSFPKFDEIQRKTPGGFVQSEVAQTSVKERAAEVASTLKFGAGGLVIGGIAVYLLAQYLRGRK